MAITLFGWLVFTPFTLAGLFLGILGLLYLIYERFHRQSKILHKCIWVLSSGFLVSSAIIISYLLLFGTQRLADGYSLNDVWQGVLIVIPSGFVIQFAFFPPPPRIRPPLMNWVHMLYPLALSSVLLIGFGGVATPQGANSIEAVIFALPGILVIGALNGFSPAMQWGMLHLPEKRLIVIGWLLVCCAFVLLLGPPLPGILGNVL